MTTTGRAWMQIDLLNQLASETFSSLTVRGRGKEVNDMCVTAGIVLKGTMQDKVYRLLKWAEDQCNEETCVVCQAFNQWLPMSQP